MLNQLPTNIQPNLKSYFVDNHNTSLSRQRLKTMIDKLQREINEENKPINWTPWIIGGGVILVLLVVIIAYLLGKKQGDKRY